MGLRKGIIIVFTTFLNHKSSQRNSVMVRSFVSLHTSFRFCNNLLISSSHFLTLQHSRAQQVQLLPLSPQSVPFVYPDYFPIIYGKRYLPPPLGVAANKSFFLSPQKSSTKVFLNSLLITQQCSDEPGPHQLYYKPTMRSRRTPLGGELGQGKESSTENRDA